MKSQHQRQYKCILEGLKRERRRCQMTQTEAAQHFGKHAPFISKIESGERRVDVIELAEFCNLYGLPLSKFLKECGLL